MEKQTCKICGKVIEGFTQKHVDFLMMQHNLTHRDKTTTDTLKSQNKTSEQEDDIQKKGGENNEKINT